MSEKIKINKHSGSITFTNNGISFSQFGIAKEILDLVDNQQQKIERLEKENKELKQPQVFIDCENMEERYGRDLYEDYLKEKIEQLENIKKEAIEYIKENSKSYSLPNTIKDMRYIDFYKLLDILNK